MFSLQQGHETIHIADLWSKCNDPSYNISVIYAISKSLSVKSPPFQFISLDKSNCQEFLPLLVLKKKVSTYNKFYMSFLLLPNKINLIHFQRINNNKEPSPAQCTSIFNTPGPLNSPQLVSLVLTPLFVSVIVIVISCVCFSFCFVIVLKQVLAWISQNFQASLKCNLS